MSPAHLPPAIPVGGQAAPSLTPSRRRRLSLKALTAPFRRSSERNDPSLPAVATPEDHKSTRSRRTRTPSIFSGRLSRKGWSRAVGTDQQPGTEEGGEKKRGINWTKRTAGQPLPSAASAIRSAWVRQQVIERPPPVLDVQLDSRPSLSSVGSLLFPATSPGQPYDIFPSPSPLHASETLAPANYPDDARAATSSRTDDAVRTMARPFPSRPALTDEQRGVSLIAESPVTPAATSEAGDDGLSYDFPLPPPRQSDLPTPPASPPFPPAAFPPSASAKTPPAEAERIQPTPLDTPPHTPQRGSFTLSPESRSASSARRASTLLAGDSAVTRGPPTERRPLSLTVPASSSSNTIPIFTRVTNPSHRLVGHARSASATVPSDSASLAISTGNPLRRPVSIAPQLGGWRMSASLASSGAFAASDGSKRQSWASMQSSSSGTCGRVGLLDEVRRGAEAREQRGIIHRRGDSGATVTQENGGGKWQPVEAGMVEKENVAVGAPARPPLAEEVQSEAPTFADEADEMFSDARLRALIQELGI
ncbi:hypothetical protein JCM10213_004173 [Rhodosporidiobolus nylandii]